MQEPDYEVNLKALAIAEHVTEGGTGGFLGNFIHKDEFFWTENPGGGGVNPNIAPAATVTASSEAAQYGQVAAKAIDEVIDGTRSRRKWLRLSG